MLSNEQAYKRIENGEHTVEVVFTFMDGMIESYFPTAEAGGWHSSTLDDQLMDVAVINIARKGHRMHIPFKNVRYFEVIVHNPPEDEDDDPVIIDMFRV